ncbi:MAG: hypothetical protein R8G34_09145 [Paracoccaceae bacterium]|nr:hypothetical protein [Paracoccaceae bacterium]
MSDTLYIEFDEFIDVEASLANVDICLDALSSNPLLWNQIIVGCHAALTSACVAILTRTDGSGALNKGSERKLRKHHNERSRNAETQAQRKQPEYIDPVYPCPLFVLNLREMLKALPGDLSVTIPKNLKIVKIKKRGTCFFCFPGETNFSILNQRLGLSRLLGCSGLFCGHRNW